MPSLNARARRILRAEIADDPARIGYAGREAAGVFELLTIADRPRIRPGPVLVDELDILSAFDDPADGEALLGKLETEAGVNPLVARVLRWIAPGGDRGEAAGVDVTHPKLRAMLAGLVGRSGITQAEVDTVLALGVETIDRLAEIGLPWRTVRLGHVVVALQPEG